MMKLLITTAICGAIALSGCASSPEDVQSQYVSPMQYQSYGCPQIELELRGISDRVTQLTGQQRRRANQDAWAVGGSLIFWPALFFLMRGDKADELGRLKGQYDALVLAGQQKGCAATQQASAATS